MASASFDIEVFDRTPPVITLLGDATIEVEKGSGPYVDPGASVTDNADPGVTVDIDDSAVDTDAVGSYEVIFSATDASGNNAEISRTVEVVQSGYAGSTGIHVSKHSVKRGRTVYLWWAWTDENGHPVDSSGDTQLLTIENCHTGERVVDIAANPGTNNVYYLHSNYWKYRWRTHVPKGKYCATVTSSLTGQVQTSREVRVR